MTAVTGATAVRGMQQSKNYSISGKAVKQKYKVVGNGNTQIAVAGRDRANLNCCTQTAAACVIYDN